MKFQEIFLFEFGYQARRVRTWVYFVVLLVVASLFITSNYIFDARKGRFFLNSPWVLAMITVLTSQLAWLVTTSVAGGAAARDVKTRMYPLIYTSPISKADYLGGRFLAAFVLNALILFAVPVGILRAVYLPGVEAEILGPFRPAAYILVYFVLAVPNAFVATAIQFSLAVLSGRAAISYVGSVLVTVASRLIGPIAAMQVGPQAGKLLDPNGLLFVSELQVRTPIETNTSLIGLDGTLLVNRLLWVGIALGMLAFTHFRFRFAHRAVSTKSKRYATT
ncbi:MAG TPA: hypothetical protein VGR43_09630 [Dehalococcoidia bacterium]|jgi:hypothetical protein|nr:hypothetical protein [Dehalococcoidia bacterium]